MTNETQAMQIFAKFEPKIRGHIRKQSSWANWQDIDDITQETMIKVLVGLNSFQGQSDLSTWIFRICFTTMANFYKRTLRRTRTFPPFSQYEFNNAFTNGSESKMINKIDYDRRMTAIRKEIAQLPERDQTIFILRIQGYTFTEIAVTLEIPLGTVKQAYLSNIEKMRKKLQPRETIH